VVKPLNTKTLIGVNDYVVLMTIVVEFFQYCAMGPSFASLTFFVQEIGYAMSVNMEAFIELSHGMYWLILTIVILIVFLWIVLSIIIIWRLDLKFENSDCCVSFGMLAEMALPIIGNAGFLPIVSILLDVFSCTESVGDEFSDSFMDRD
jgi:hypothetical protein